MARDREQYAVLRSSETSRAFDVSAGARATMEARPARPGEFGWTLEIVEAKRQEAAELLATREVKALAPILPMRLYEPVEVMATAPGPKTTSWGVEAVNAHVSAFTGRGAKVAILDTGIDAGHDAFKGLTIVEKDFSGEGNGDFHGHGTHCAATIFGRDVDGTRVGIARGVDAALVGKVLDRHGQASTLAIIAGIQWALDEGAHVISMSLGMDFPGYVQQLVEKGIPLEVATSAALEGYRRNVGLFGALSSYIEERELLTQPTVIVAAAGNESHRPDWDIAVSPPAAASGVISVAALAQEKAGFGVAPFSNTEALLAAPGVAIVSAKAGGGLVAMSGTSMATPHVAGVAALWIEKLIGQQTFTQESLKAKLLGTARLDSLSGSFSPEDVGNGLVQSP